MLFEINYSKPPLLYTDQVDLLVSRNLARGDSQLAIQYLRYIGYYRLNAYFAPFRESGSDGFHPGTALDDILNLYRFDSGLRLLTMQAMDQIEVAVRAVFTYRTAHSLGTFGYAEPSNFSESYDHKRLMGLLRREERRSSETFVATYRRKYTGEEYLPVWMATELISFGALSEMYASLRTKLRKEIAREFNQPAPVFQSWLHWLAAVRNICAHHGRLWNRELSVKPELLNTWKAQGIDNSRYHVISLVMHTLLADVAPGSAWTNRLKGHFDAFPSIDPHPMRFPANWRSQKFWK